MSVGVPLPQIQPGGKALPLQDVRADAFKDVPPGLSGRSESAEFLEGSPFTDILFRTEGYAGSAITLELMYCHMAVNDPRLAQRAGGRLAYRDNRPSTHAVRNRAGRAVELALPVIGSYLGPVEVACFAGGTGLFASILMSCLNPDRAADVKIRLFDMDPCAVLAAQRRIHGQRLKNVRATWNKLLSNGKFNTNSGYLNGRFVFAECLGIFDDFPDKLTKSDIRGGRALPAYGHALRNLFSTIRPGGMLVVGNFVPSHPDQAYMGLGNRPLILRDEDEMERLVHKFGVLLPNRGDTVAFERVKGAKDTQILMLLSKEPSITYSKVETVQFRSKISSSSTIG